MTAQNAGWRQVPGAPAAEPYGQPVAAQRGNNFDVQSLDGEARPSGPARYQNAPAYVHATGHVLTVDDSHGAGDHVIHGSLGAPKPRYTQHDVALKLKVCRPPPDIIPCS